MERSPGASIRPAGSRGRWVYHRHPAEPRVQRRLRPSPRLSSAPGLLDLRQGGHDVLHCSAPGGQMRPGTSKFAFPSQDAGSPRGSFGIARRAGLLSASAPPSFGAFHHERNNPIPLPPPFPAALDLGRRRPRSACPRILRAEPRLTIIETRIISLDHANYHGWPTLARKRNGQLLLAFSGGREGHVCPFGKSRLDGV